MELEEFITQTLVAIRAGIKKANKKIIDLKDFGVENTYTMGNVGDKINFDIAVTATEENGGKAGGGMQIAVLRMGADVESKSVQSNISRIKFAVDLNHNQMQ